MQEEIFNFIYSNWQGIIIALAIGLLFFILSNYFLRKYIASAEKERLKQAKNALLDVLDSLIINKQDLYINKINNLLKAIDREHSVVLSEIVSPQSLLQDLELRFEKSHHLDHTQKEEYCNQIENQIKELRRTEETLTVPKRYSEVVESLTEEIKSKNTEKALENLELLKKKVKEREEYSYRQSPLAIRNEMFLRIVTIITGIILVIIMSIIFNILF